MEKTSKQIWMAQAAMLAGLSYGSESAGAAHAMSQTLGGSSLSHMANVWQR